MFTSKVHFYFFFLRFLQLPARVKSKRAVKLAKTCVLTRFVFEKKVTRVNGRLVFWKAFSPLKNHRIILFT